MRIFKYTLKIFLFFLLVTKPCLSQKVLDEVINVSYRNLKIVCLLDSLHSQYGYNFSYDPSVLPADSIIDANYSQKTLFEILSDVFRNYNLSFKEIESKQVIISNYKRKTALEDYITLSGVVVSDDNQQFIPLVNIAVKGHPLGTTSNMEGKFQFLIPRRFLGKEIVMSAIGFHHKKMHVPNNDTSLIVLLEPQTIQLNEIKVEYLKPDEIIKRFIENRRFNYFCEPMLLTAFFRESVKQDGKFIEVSEAVLDIYKSSYLNVNDNEEARFIKGRKKSEGGDVSIARLKLAGGPALFSAIDVAKHLDFISQENGTNYFYVYKGKDIVHDRVVYKLGFKPIVETEKIYYEGELYIDIETFALISAGFRMTKRTLRHSDKYLIQKHAKKIKSTPVFTNYHVDYRPYNDKWILNSVRGELIIRMQDKRKKTKTQFHALADLLITNAQNGKGQRIKYSETFKTNYVLADKITNYDSNFWKDYNVISPEEELEKVFKSSPVEINVVPQRKDLDLK